MSMGRGIQMEAGRLGRLALFLLPASVAWEEIEYLDHGLVNSLVV